MKKSIRASVIAGWVVSLFLIFLYGQNQATLEVSSEKIGLNEQLTLSITVTGEGSAKTESTPDLGGLEGFRLVAGPNTSSQFQWINGQTSSSLTYSYVLLPAKTGRFTLGPFSVGATGKKLVTNSVSVEVVADNASPSRPQRPGARRLPGGWPSLMDEQEEPAAADPGGEVIVAVEPNRKQAYPGQKIDIDYHLYTRYSVQGLELKESPALKGFWVEDIKIPQSPQAVPATLGGKSYSSFLIKKQAIYANSPGAHTIPSFLFALSVRTRGRDPFSFFNMGFAQTIYRKTEPVEMTILPFPENGKPTDFQNLSGSFQLEAKSDKIEVKAGDAVALTVTLTGNGNLNTVGDLPLPPLPHFQIFSSKSRVQSGETTGAKIWDVVLIPQTSGMQTIPGISFSYFHPDEQRYKTAASQPISIKVLPSPQGAIASSLGNTQQRQLTRQGTDINFIKIQPVAWEEDPRSSMSLPVFFLWLGLPVFLNLASWWFLKQRSREHRNSPVYRRKRAASKALDSLRSLEKSLASLSHPQIYGGLGDTIATFLSERFQLPAIELTREQVQERLRDMGVPEGPLEQTMKILDRCDFARFAPSAISATDASTLIQEMRSLIQHLDQYAK